MDSKHSPGAGSQLQQFLLLANSSKGLATVELIKNALKQNTIFVYGELLAHPNIQSLKNTDHEPYLRLLQVFSNGTYQDYKANQASLPQLTKEQRLKLKQLSIVSHAALQKTLSYKQLMKDLDVETVRELEDMIIECIYAGLITGKLDQKDQALEVTSVIGRDIDKADISSMIAKLDSWIASADDLVSVLERQGKAADNAHQEAADHKKAVEEAIEATKAQIQNSKKGKGKGNDLMAEMLQAQAGLNLPP